MKRFCNKIGCSMRAIKIKTDAKKCIGCGDKLNDDLDYLSMLFGGVDI